MSNEIIPRSAIETVGMKNVWREVLVKVIALNVSASFYVIGLLAGLQIAEFIRYEYFGIEPEYLNWLGVVIYMSIFNILFTVGFLAAKLARWHFSYGRINQAIRVVLICWIVGLLLAFGIIHVILRVGISPLS